MQSSGNTYVIMRQDRDIDPITIVTEALRIGRDSSCEVVLNHPLVSRLHAGLTEMEGRFYLTNLSHANGMILNGSLLAAGEAQMLVDGDIAQIGPFFMDFRREGGVIHLRVLVEIGLKIGDVEGRSDAPETQLPQSFQDQSVTRALKVYWDARTRRAGKIRSGSRLHPQNRPRIHGKRRFNWMPTSDLVRPWPVVIIPAGIFTVCLLTLIAAMWHPEIFSLQSVSEIPDPNRGYRSLYPFLLSDFRLYMFGVIAFFLVLTGIVIALRDVARTRLLLKASSGKRDVSNDLDTQIMREDLERIRQLEPNGPDYPHPVIFPDRCIGCHACVEACPHDVLAIVGGIAAVVAREQCMEDTSCQVECPVNPKACIVVNTTKKIKPRPVPTRDPAFMTNVPGCYIIGDVSGTPLIKNAANEGADVIKHIARELKNETAPEPKAELDVTIIGAGPAGLSASIIAQQFNLSYVCIEQDKVLATIEAYPIGKYLFFKPDTMPSRAAFAIDGPGEQREKILDLWVDTMKSNGVVINEGESCKSVKRAADGDYFMVQTEKGVEKQKITYRARRVVLALGNRGTPMKLRLPGEEMKVTRDGRTEDKVKYKLVDPESYKGRKIAVVGAGNSAIEAAVDLVARRHGDQISFRPPEEINEVTLIIRSDMKNDLKFGNKLQVYQCIDEGKIKVHFGTAIKEIRDDEVVLMYARSGEVKTTIPNDYIFAMIGGDRPTKFLESIGIKLG